MVQIITPDTRTHFELELAEMHERRYEVLVKGLNWRVPGARSGYDVDQFDTSQTIYLVEKHPESGQLIASVRFNPTTSPHMMSEVFADQCEFGGVPSGPNIWEASRYVLDRKRMDGDLFFRTRMRMGIAMTEFCLQSGIVAMTWLTHKMLYAAALKGWPTRPLGAPKFYEEDQAEYIAAISDITEDALQGFRDRLGSDEPVTLAMMPLGRVDQPIIQGAA